MKQDFRYFIRRLIPRSFYHWVSMLANSLAILRCEGPGTLSQLSREDGSEVTLHLRSLKHPFTLRRAGPQLNALVQNVFRGEYDRWLGGLKPRVIVDAGGYIGDLTCHWATRFPEARIITLEPSLSSLARAEENTRPYGARVKLIRAGLGGHEGFCTLSGEEMGTHLVNGDAGELGTRVRVMTVDRLMSEQALERIDLLKIDIEGAEGEVLAGCSDWIDRVGCLVVEFHGERLESDGVAELSRHGMKCRRHRSLVTFSREFE